MFYKNFFLLLLLLLGVFISCSAGAEISGGPAMLQDKGTLAPGWEKMPDEAVPLPAELDEIAELERSGGFVPGLGLAESKLREDAGDYAGAVLAVYKELAWAYALGAADVSGDVIKQGLQKLLEAETPFTEEAREKIEEAVGAILAYFNGSYDQAEKSLGKLFENEKELDSFSRYMLLVCALEKGTAGREDRSAYGAIRSRYVFFPEYWYHLARAEDSAQYAERCINLSPAGPYAAECRVILAKAMGLKAEDAPVLKTRMEIETAVKEAVNQRNPELLGPLLPLAALPDNPSTLYASGAMRALAAESIFRSWFSAEAEKARGRLAERLQYISRG